MKMHIKDSVSDVLNIIKLISVILACIAAVSFFIYETKGLPPRVQKLELEVEKSKQRIDSVQLEISKAGIKQDIMLEDLKIVKSYLMKGANR